MLEVPVKGTSFLDEEAQSYPALQCRLECEVGYIAQRTPIITCVNGEYEPYHPSTFVCQPAAALIISQGGEVEIFSHSEKCSMAITTFQKFAGTGRTLSLLDEELILLGDDDFGTKEGKYISIQKPRDGLLAMKYTIENVPLQGSPHRHTSLVSQNSLAVLGGKFKSRGGLSKLTWTGLSLHWKNGTKFRADFSDSCAVKLAADVHILFGGEHLVNHQKKQRAQVIKINTTEQVALEMNPMQYARKSHGCELLNDSLVLLSGGLDQSIIQPDELYNVSSGKVATVLDLKQSLRRSHHSIVRMGTHVFAFGGRDSNNTTPSVIAEFITATQTWKNTTRQLFSANTSETTTTVFPIMSLDCATNCECGMSRIDGRIANGNETKANSYPWMAALVRDEDVKTEYINSACSAVLIGNRFALTAAHCLYTMDKEELLPAESFAIVLGVHNRANRKEANRQHIRVSKVFVHGDFNNNSLNDIALLKLEERMDLSVYSPACLPFTSEATLVGQNGHIYGWGDMGTEHTSTDVLQEALVPIIDNSRCLERMNQTEGAIGSLLLCAGGSTAGPCKGDSGGPLTVLNEKGAHVLEGIISRRIGEACTKQEYSVFTRVYSYLPWIESIIKENGGMTSCSFNFSSPPSLGDSEEPPSPPGLVILGGQSTDRQLASVETFGFENCMIPPLPEPRFSFGSFITLSPTPQLAVCGGWWAGRPFSSDCLTLNRTSGQWERGKFTNGPLGDDIQGVITIVDKSVCLVHRIGLSLLSSGTQTWVAGPVFDAPAVCGCKISSKSFVTIHFSDANNVREYSLSNNKVEPQPNNIWPSLSIKRSGPGCAATSYHLVVAGGVSDMDKILSSVDIFDIKRKSLRKGGSLQQARAYFQIVPVGSKYPRLLAIGGKDQNSSLVTSEWWEEEEDSWEVGPPLTTGRSNFAALMTMPQLICFDIEPSAHSCTVEEDTEQTCTFSTHEQGMQIIGVSSRIFTDILGGRICFANFGYLLHSAMFSSLSGF